MSNARQEEIFRKGLLKSLLDGTVELKDLAGTNIDLDTARQAYLQGVQETTQALIELVQENMATKTKQDEIMSAIDTVQAGTNILPNVSSEKIHLTRELYDGVELTLINIQGVGYTDLILAHAYEIADAHETIIKVYCDDIISFSFYFKDLSFFGFTPETPGISLINYAVDGACTMVFTHKFEFRQSLKVTAQNTIANPIVGVHVHPTLMR